MNKKVILLTSLVSIISLSGCKGGNKNSGNEGIGDAWWKTEGTLNKDSNGDIIFEDVEIALETVVAGNDETAFRNIVEDFNEEYAGKIRVTVSATNQSTYESSVAQRIEQETNAPDLLMSHQKAHKWFADSKLVQPFDEVIEATGLSFNINDYMSILGDLSDLGYEGTQFQIPIDAQSMVILYNKDMLKRLGFENAPTNNEELMAICKKFKQTYSGSDYLAMSIPSDETFYNDYLFNTALVQNGVELYNSSDYKVDWTSDDQFAGWENARKAINTLYDNNYAKFGDSGSSRFFENKTLFHFCLPWDVDALLRSYATANDKTLEAVKESSIGGCSMANLFNISETSTTGEYIFGDSHSFLLSTTVKDINKKAACLVFAKWFTENAQAGADWAEAGHISASHTIINSDTYRENEFVVDYINEFYLDLNQFQTIGNNPYYSDLITVLRATTTAISDTKDDLKTILQSKETELNEIIDFSGIFG